MMRILFLLLSATFLLWATDASEAARRLGVESDYAQAWQKAQQEKKILILVIVKQHCRWCHKLIDRTLSDPSVKEKLDSDFVTVIVDKDDTYPKVFRENFFPSTFFIDYTTQKSVYENVGYINAASFKNDLQEALKIQHVLYGEEKP
jgi:thioredoxin-related protein